MRCRRSDWACRLDEEELNATGMRPGEHGAAAEFLAIIGLDGFGQATCLRQLVEDARQMQTSHRTFRNNGHSLIRGIIDHGQILDDTPLCRSVEHKVHRPDLIGRQRTSQWVTVCHGDFLALAPADLQARLGIKPVQPLVIDLYALLPQLQVDHAGSDVLLNTGGASGGIVPFTSICSTQLTLHPKYRQASHI